MNKIAIAFYLLLGATRIGLAQDFPEKGKEYDSHIYNFLDSLIDSNSVTLEEFLTNTKPFSKWDVRPLKRNEFWGFDTALIASDIPNIFWGSFAKKYNLSQQDAMGRANKFLANGASDKGWLAGTLYVNLKQFDKLSKLIGESGNEIFLCQPNLQRVDNLFKENNKFWNYVLAPDSPFPISNQLVEVKGKGFSAKQIEILNLLNELKIYSAKKTPKGIFYLVDGFTDNSYGFYYSLNKEMEKDNFLFQIVGFEKINDNYFYYVAN